MRGRREMDVTMSSPVQMSDQSHAIAFLSDAKTFGMAGPVEQVITHCSMVFLAGERAYKLKRAVKFSYLDFTTLALRERFCRAELAVNQRAAPALYLRVRSITRGPAGVVAFDGRGDVIDWVVEMRRFDQEDLFDRMAETGRLNPALMTAVADHIAGFHTRAEPTPDHGGQARFAEILAANRKNLGSSSPPLSREFIQRHHVQSSHRLREVGTLLDRRTGDGMVRRCHGDLHLRNICLFENRPLLFDAIEFNDDLSCIDVLYDLAFLLMDLVHRNRADLANVVFNRYLDRTGDDAGLKALPLFLSTRAAVRAHVQGALARVPDKKTAAAQAASDYLALALTLNQKHQPRIIALGGLSGTGKSTVARAVAPLFSPAPGARIVRSDVVRKRLACVPFETRLPPSGYTPTASRKVYAALRADSSAIIAAGYTVILDATFLLPQERNAVDRLAREANLPFTGLWLEAPADTLAARVRGRESDASDADLAVLERQIKADAGVIEWRRIDASGDIRATVAAAKRHVCSPPRPIDQ